MQPITRFSHSSLKDQKSNIKHNQNLQIFAHIRWLRNNQTGKVVFWPKEATPELIIWCPIWLSGRNSHPQQQPNGRDLTAGAVHTVPMVQKWDLWNDTWKHINRLITFPWFDKTNGILRRESTKINNQIWIKIFMYLHSNIQQAPLLISSSLLMTYFLFFSSLPHGTKNTPLC